MSSPAFKFSDELVAQQMLGAVASAIHQTINLCSDPLPQHDRNGNVTKLTFQGEWAK